MGLVVVIYFPQKDAHRQDHKILSSTDNCQACSSLVCYSKCEPCTNFHVLKHNSVYFASLRRSEPTIFLTSTTRNKTQWTSSKKWSGQKGCALPCRLSTSTTTHKYSITATSRTRNRNVALGKNKEQLGGRVGGRVGGGAAAAAHETGRLRLLQLAQVVVAFTTAL